MTLDSSLQSFPPPLAYFPRITRFRWLNCMFSWWEISGLRGFCCKCCFSLAFGPRSVYKAETASWEGAG